MLCDNIMANTYFVINFTIFIIYILSKKEPLLLVPFSQKKWVRKLHARTHNKQNVIRVDQIVARNIIKYFLELSKCKHQRLGNRIQIICWLLSLLLKIKNSDFLPIIVRNFRPKMLRVNNLVNPKRQASLRKRRLVVVFLQSSKLSVVVPTVLG